MLSIWLLDNVLIVHKHQSTAVQQCNHTVSFPSLGVFSERLGSNLGFLHGWVDVCVCIRLKSQKGLQLCESMLIPHAYASCFFYSISGISFNPSNLSCCLSLLEERSIYLSIYHIPGILIFLANCFSCPSHKMLTGFRLQMNSGKMEKIWVQETSGSDYHL